MPTFPTWKQAVAEINSVIGPPSSKQAALARHVGLNFTKNEPAVVLAGRLRAVLSEQLHLESLAPSATLQIALEDTCEAVGRKRIPKLDTNEEVRAWIAYLRLKQRRDALRRLKLSAGDIVKSHLRYRDLGVREVASIRDDGCVYFRGGRGLRAWPDTLSIVERLTEGPDSTLRIQAQNDASDRSLTGEWSVEKDNSLVEFRVVSSDFETLGTALEQFEETLATAADEAPLQQLFERYPVLLGSLLGRSPRYVVPRPNLAGKYVPDFLLADVDSDGGHWIFVELESPTARIFVNSGKKFSKNAQRGIDQIKEWRRWIDDNRNFARRHRKDSGLGLPDIEAQAPGLVIVGRTPHLKESNEGHRRQLKNENKIELRTYDGVLKQIRANLEFSGPPAVNPYLLRNSFPS